MGENSEKEIVITYNTLFELLRREKDNDDLQKLDQTFFSDLIAYMKEKMQIMEKGESLFSGEKAKTEQQITSIKKIITELYERRERKIINMALNKSKTKSEIVDDSNLLNEEKQFFENLMKVLDSGRENVLFNILNMKAPQTKEIEPLEQTGMQAEPDTSEKRTKDGLHQESKETEHKEESNSVKLKFLKAVPSFVGTELEEYGPYEEGETAELPKEISKVLINKERAEIID